MSRKYNKKELLNHLENILPESEYFLNVEFERVDDEIIYMITRPEYPLSKGLEIKIKKEIDLLQEMYSDIKVEHKNHNLKIFIQNLEIQITLVKDYPFSAPDIHIIKNNRSVEYVHHKLDWTPVFDLRTIISNILNDVAIVTINKEKEMSLEKVLSTI